VASDGGIFRSTDAGKNFHAAGSISTLSCVNIAGVALKGKGPVISLNTGDNDGFCSTDGGTKLSRERAIVASVFFPGE
jgi:hypothetical protein